MLWDGVKGIHSVSKHSPSTCFVPGPVLGGSGHDGHSPALTGLTAQWWDRHFWFGSLPFDLGCWWGA